VSAFSKPRVHWVSPIPDAQTDIAHYTRRILPELAAATNLVLWTDAESWDSSLDRICPVRHLDPDRVTPDDFAQAGQGEGPDAIFVHIGNSWVFHSGLLRLVRRIPSVIVLHDLAVQELCFDAMHNQRFDQSIYEAEMARWHGADGLAKVQKVFDGKMTPIELSRDIPGFELTLDRAVAVLAHTPAAFDATVATGMVPAYQLDLPFRPSETPVSSRRSTEGLLNFVQFGYIGPNRRLEQVLDALAPLRDEINFRFDIMGNVWDPEYLNDRIDKLGLKGRVEIHGFVAEAELDAKLAQAHLVFNLRYPTMGEASGSQLRIWNASAASVVTDLGWYGSLPDETVFKIPLQEEAAALQALVRRMATDRNLGVQMGAAGRTRLEERHTPALYAKGISEVASRFASDGAAALLARSARNALQRSPDPTALLKARLVHHLEN